MINKLVGLFKGWPLFGLAWVLDLKDVEDICPPFDVRTLLNCAFLCPWQLGLGIAEGLADVNSKLAVAQRQLDGATSGASAGKNKAGEKSRKAKSLASQVETLTHRCPS